MNLSNDSNSTNPLGMRTLSVSQGLIPTENSNSVSENLSNSASFIPSSDVGDSLHFTMLSYTSAFPNSVVPTTPNLPNMVPITQQNTVPSSGQLDFHTSPILPSMLPSGTVTSFIPMNPGVFPTNTGDMNSNTGVIFPPATNDNNNNSNIFVEDVSLHALPPLPTNNSNTTISFTESLSTNENHDDHQTSNETSTSNGNDNTADDNNVTVVAPSDVTPPPFPAPSSNE